MGPSLDCFYEKKAHDHRTNLAGALPQTIEMMNQGAEETKQRQAEALPMIFDFKLPLISPHMSEALVECLYATPGSTVRAGDKLLDLSIDLSSAFAQDCPPVSFFRIIMRENAILREFRLACGQACKVGELIAVFSTGADEVKDFPAQRGVRFVTAGIIHHGGMWTGNDH
jgi:hypothetical protein